MSCMTTYVARPGFGDIHSSLREREKEGLTYRAVRSGHLHILQQHYLYVNTFIMITTGNYMYVILEPLLFSAVPLELL